MAIIQQSLKDALADRKLAELPVECNLEADWSEAIVLVARAVGGVQSYAYATKKDGKISVVRDFGFAYQCSSVKSILKAFPVGVVQLSAGAEKVGENEKETQNPPSDNKEEDVDGLNADNNPENGDYSFSDKGEEAMRVAEADNVRTAKTTAKRGRPRGTTKINSRSIW